MTIDNLKFEELLDLRFCDLELKIEGTWLAECIERLYKELRDKGISFKPSFYLADEWLTPDGEPIVGIAFYLAHPKLIKLEKKIMGDVEGGTVSYCMKLLRHEIGHAINYAYLLHRRKRWRELFGPFSADYPARYKYHPYSKSYVTHLDNCYAQYHPDEDFAETFAVWLTPGSNWKKRYAEWPALKKLEYIDSLMREISEKTPSIRKGKKYWAVSKMTTYLRTHYKRKRELYADRYPEFHDSALLKIFMDGNENHKKDVSSVIKKYKKEILKYVAIVTGERKYVIIEIINLLLQRCDELDILTSMKEGEVLHWLTAYITTLTMNYYYTGTFMKKRI